MKHGYSIDHEIEAIIAHEQQRLEDEINLIASENYASSEVLRVTGSVQYKAHVLVC